MSLAAAARVLTVVGRGAPPTPASLPWFPVVGATLGALLGLAWWGGNQLWSPFLAAALVVALDAVLTGLLHYDGLAGTADGLLPHLHRDRRLQVMAQSDVGAFGVSVVVITVVVRLAAITAVPIGVKGVAVLAAALTLSRTVMAVAAAALPYARPSGFALSFGTMRPLWPALPGLAITITLAVFAGMSALAAVAVGALVAVGVLQVALRRVGGFTGDVLGAMGLLTETAFLVTAAASW